MAEAQQLLDGLGDALLRPALEAFFEDQKQLYLSQLTRAVRQRKSVKDTWMESELAGKIAVYESILAELDTFARTQMQEASQ